MPAKKFYYIVIIFLFISNLCLLGIYYNTSSEFNTSKGKHDGPRNIIIERLHFNEEQIQQYDELISWHRTNIRLNEIAIAKLKSVLYKNLNADEQFSDSIISEINKVQYQIELIHIKHFKDIQLLCDEKQQKDFIALTNDLSKLFRPKPKHKD